MRRFGSIVVCPGPCGLGQTEAPAAALSPFWKGVLVGAGAVVGLVVLVDYVGERDTRTPFQKSMHRMAKLSTKGKWKAPRR